MTAPVARWHVLADPAARAAYERLWSASETTPYASLAFADAACAGYGFRGHLILVGDAAEPDAGLAVYEKRVGPLRAAALPPYAQFASPVLRYGLDAAAVHQHASPLDAIAAALAERMHQAALRLDVGIVDARPLRWAGWSLTPAFHAEAIIPDDPFEAWGRSTRKRVRRYGEAYEVQSGAEHIGSIVGLAEQSHTAKGLGHPPRTSIEALAHGLVEADLADAYLATPRSGGAPEAGLVMARHGTRAHYWIVGSTPGPAMTVLVAHAVEAMQARGLARVHYGGANTAGVAEFKRGFGAEIVPVLRARWVGPRWLRALDAIRPVG